MQLCDPWKSPSCSLTVHYAQGRDRQTALIRCETAVWHNTLGTALPFHQPSRTSDKGS